MEIALYLLIAASLLLMISPAIYFIVKGSKKTRDHKRKTAEFFELYSNPAKITLTRGKIKETPLPVFVDEVDDGNTDLIQKRSGKIGWSHGADVDLFLSPGKHILLARITQVKQDSLFGNKLISIGPIRLEVTVEAGRNYTLTYTKEKNEFNLQEER